MFFKSADNFRYGKVSELNMLAFRKKSNNSPMGMKIHFKIQKIDQMLPHFWKLFEKLDKKWYTRVQMFFRIFFNKMADSSANNVGRQISWKDVSRRKFRKNFWIKIQTRTYCNLSHIFISWNFQIWLSR